MSEIMKIIDESEKQRKNKIIKDRKEKVGSSFHFFWAFGSSLSFIEDPTLRREASIPFLCNLKQKSFFNEIEYDKLYPPGSATARIYGTPKMHKFCSSDSFPTLCPIVSSIGTFHL